MEKKLSVNNLVVSFRTPAGKVQAVRDISFDLNKGETLAIVGESGSGKSVTSKAILGILAGNSIIEGGSIIYDGMDLLKIGEDDFYRIRGDKIAMIFQDPLSSLNPIMRVGKQLTEAMLLKGKAHQKASRNSFNQTLALLEKTMAAAGTDSTKAHTLCQNFDKFEFKHIEIEQTYNTAHEAAIEVLDDITDALFHIEKKALDDPKYTLKEIVRLAKLTPNDFVVSNDKSKLEAAVKTLESVIPSDCKSKNFTASKAQLEILQGIMTEALKKEKPDFFSMGYYAQFSGKSVPVSMPIDELNKMMRTYLEESFLNEFCEDASKALSFSAQESARKKKEAIDVISANRSIFDSDSWDVKSCKEAAEKMIQAVEASIDPIEIHKDGLAWTFAGSIRASQEHYFGGIDKNKAAAKKHAKQQKKYDNLTAKGKQPTWKVTPSTAVDLELEQDNVRELLNRLTEHYKEDLAKQNEVDFAKKTKELIEFFRENASGAVSRVTKEMAKYKALKLLEEVGISEPRKRYRQYPFEFSGGMRQRIVIAIALAADPDILICDEPTTALDVTIQAQIMELINHLKEKRNLSIIFITHDLGVVANMADRIGVMYAGKLVETGTADDIFYSPAHPYTWALLSAMPDVDTNDRLEAIPGTPPNMIYPPVGDAFADRNKYALKIDFEMQPPMFKISDTHYAATWLLHPDAPKVEIPKIITDRIARMKEKGGKSNA